MSFTDLGNEILSHCKVLDAHIEANSLPKPSLGHGGPLEFPMSSSTAQEVIQARQFILDATQKLQGLTLGPAALLVWQSLTVSTDLATPCVICG